MKFILIHAIIAHLVIVTTLASQTFVGGAMNAWKKHVIATPVQGACNDKIVGVTTKRVTIKGTHDCNVYNQSATPNETPVLIKRKLAEFELALDDIGDEDKRGYLLAKEKGPDECSDAHKLVFLRCEVFNVDRAVKRFVKYWDKRVELFGEDKAFLPLSIDGALKDEMDSIKLDYLQVANHTDPDGRAILLFDFNKERKDVSSESLLRVVWYQVHVALRQESCQKRGIVVYVRCIDKFTDWRPSLSKKITKAGRGILPIRFAGMHFMQPPPHTKLVLEIVKPLLGNKLRNRFYHHSGSIDDLLKSLSRFGLGDSDLLPTTFGGKLEVSSNCSTSSS